MKNRIIVTGGLGFIGRNIIKRLNQEGYDGIILCDDLLNNVGEKWRCLEELQFDDIIHKDDLLNLRSLWERVDTVIHFGANSSTTGEDCLKLNYEYSKDLMANSVVYGVRKFIYASSASVYGSCETNIEDPQYEKPLNLYAYSKKLFDNIVRRGFNQNKFPFPMVGLRPFNVYGPGEEHKGFMASPMYRFNEKVKANKKLQERLEGGDRTLFWNEDDVSITVMSGDSGFPRKAEDYARDFIHVDDICNIVMFFHENHDVAGIFNAGTGNSHTFFEVAKAVENYCNVNIEIKKISMPKEILGKSQPYTCADLTKLRKAGYEKDFISLEDGIKKYLDYLNGA